MKRKYLEKLLRIAGCYRKREGKSHSIWINPETGNIETVPRHIEIKDPLAKKIMKSLGASSILEYPSMSEEDVMETEIIDVPLKEDEEYSVQKPHNRIS